MSAPTTGALPDRLKAAGLRLVDKVKAMSPATRIAAGVAALVVVVGGYVFVTWAAAPTYAPLFSNLAPADASAVVDKLNAAGIPYQLGANGTEVLVPQQDVYAQRISLAAAGVPSSPQTGYSLLDSEGVTTSEFKQRVDYQRALEGELDNTIASIDGVEKAAVHLAIPTQDVFSDGSQKTTASVLLTLSRGTALTAQQVAAVVNLVASAVPGLTTDQVTVTDSSGQVLSAGGDSVASGTMDQAVVAYQQRMTTQLQAVLDKVLGPGHAVVTVSTQLDQSKSTSTSHAYTANPSAPPLSQATTSESYSGSGAAAAGGVAGATAAATPAASPGAASTGGSYTKTTNTQDNAVGTVDTTTETAPGQVKRLGVGIVLDTSVPASVTPASIQQLMTSAAGIDTTRGDSITVQQMALDHTAADQATAAQKQAEAATAAAAARSTLIKLVAGAGIAGVVVLGAIVLLVRRRRGGRPGGLDELDLLIDPEPMPDPQPLVPAKPWGEQNLEASRKQLHDLAVEKPGDVARVLRSWLND